MKQTLLIALLALAGFSVLPAAADDAVPAAQAAQTSAPENLSAPGKPCDKPGMGMGKMQGMGGMQGMDGMKGTDCMHGKHGMMGGDGRACPPGSCECHQFKAMSERIVQLEKRLDALQMAVEMLVNQQDE